MKSIINKISFNVFVMFILVISCFIVLNNYLWFKNIRSSDINMTSPQNIEPTESKTINSINTIIEKNLFGISQSIPVKETIIDLPQTNLKLTLHGIVASSNTNSSSAMIEGSNGKVSNYFIGSEIEDDAIINSINNDNVILERRGRLETLFFPEQQNQISRVEGRPNSSLLQNNSSATVNQRIIQNTETPDQRNSRIQTPIDQQQLSSTQSNIRNRLDQLRESNL